MLTQDQIKEGNKKIEARFGDLYWTIHNGNKSIATKNYSRTRRWTNEKKAQLFCDVLNKYEAGWEIKCHTKQYDSDLNALVNILKAIERTGVIVLIEFSENKICCQIKKDRRGNIISDFEGGIEAVWLAVVEYIDYHNLNSKA